MSFLSNNHGPSLGQRNAMQPMSEINVTPMVDVMLVLLIIFMVTAPLLSVGVQVDLPKSTAPQLPQSNDPLTVSVDKQGNIFVQKTEVSAEDLGSRLVAISHANPDARIYVRGDKQIDYGRVMEVMGLINDAGFSKVALVAENKTRKKKK